jgi:hypothetical protein
MLTAVSFGDAYRAEGNYLTLIVMNFVIALAMLATPLIVRSLVGQGVQSMSSTLGPAAVAAMVAAPARVVSVAATSREVLASTGSFAKGQFANLSRGLTSSSPKKGE